MLVHLDYKSQIRLSAEIINSMKLIQGDQFEVIAEDGKIILVPITIYSERTINNYKASVDEIRESIENGEQSIFDSHDTLFAELDK